MARITPLPMTEAVMVSVDHPGGQVLVEYTTEQALQLATALIAACERSLLMDSEFVGRFQRASCVRRRLRSRP